jgi:acetyl-CoA carboxylase biotin carboxyl carrier protein
MSSPPLTDADVQAILKLLTAADHLAEFRIRYGDIEIAYSRDGRGPVMSPAPPLPAEPAAVSAATSPAPPLQPRSATSPAAGTQPDNSPQTPDVPGGVPVVSPMFGTFYRAPAPGAPPFVEVGQAVEADTVVCIIEVMKLMNSVAAGVRGTVRQILVADSAPVELGQRLVIVEPAR